MNRGEDSDLVVLTHARQGLSQHSFLRVLIERFWRPAGLAVALHQGLAPPPPGRRALLHVDLTRVPPPYLALAADFQFCLNGRAADISKRAVSRNLVTREDDYDGPVIVKTDRNHAGRPERALALATAGRWARLRERLCARLPPAWSGRLRDDRYLLFERREQVPGWIWRQPALVVERLLTERHGELYAINRWFFLGQCDLVATSLSHSPVISGGAQRRLPPHSEVPAALRQRRRELGLDYGKLDFVMIDGRAELLDANRTPASADVWTERCLDYCRRLAPGIDGFLGA